MRDHILTTLLLVVTADHPCIDHRLPSGGRQTVRDSARKTVEHHDLTNLVHTTASTAIHAGTRNVARGRHVGVW